MKGSGFMLQYKIVCRIFAGAKDGEKEKGLPAAYEMILLF
jgi:hypothetical protein